MWSALRGGALSSSRHAVNHQWKNPASSYSILARHFSSSAVNNSNNNGAEKNEELLSLAEVEKILSDVGADDVKVIKAPERCEFTDYMVIATGRSPWHVRNISQALIYQVKQKQKGAERILLPSVVGQEGGNWVVIDSESFDLKQEVAETAIGNYVAQTRIRESDTGKLIVHAVDEKARAYYNFEGLWTGNTSNVENTQDLQNAFVKVRPKNNSKKRSKACA